MTIASEAASHAASGAGRGFFGDLLKTYVPRWQCMYRETDVIALHVVSDFFIAAAYFSIPIALIYFVRQRRDIAFHWMFLFFAAFIMLCGATHVFGILSVWHAVYRLDGVVKFATAVASVSTAILLWRLIPAALALPGIEEIRRRKEQLEVLVRERTEELSAAKEKAERANRAKTEFLANMSHEIRTPMNAVLGLTQIMQTTEVPPEKRQVFLNTMAASAEQLMRLIDDLLDISRIEAGSLSMDSAPFSLSSLISEVVEINAVQADKKGISLRADAGGAPDRFIGDALRVKQILMNIVGNAVKFTDSGHVRLSVGAQVIDGAGVLDGASARVAIVVSDTGIGIAPEKAGSIFDKFTQADATITRRFGGSGLGLSIAQRLAEMMGGGIDVKSAPGEGSVFTVFLTLPVAEKDLPGKLPAEDLDLLRAHGQGRILLVEDNDANILLATSTLDLIGYDYTVAQNGSEALDILEKQEFDAVLMDLQMPVMDGLSATWLLREREQKTGAKRTPVIGVTAHAQKEDRERCLSAGMDDYLAKPFKPAALAEALKKAIRPRK